MNELTFVPETHSYYLDEEQIPSVSELIEPYSLLNTDEDSMSQRAIIRAADRGTELHSYLEYLFNDEEPMMYTAYAPYYRAIDKLLDEHVVEPYFTEQMMWAETDGVKFAGTIDCFADFDGVPTLLDWKFVSSVQKFKVGAQLNFYRMMMEQNGVAPDQMKCIQFLPERYRIYTVDASDNGIHTAIQVYKYKKLKHEKGRIQQDDINGEAGQGSEQSES